MFLESLGLEELYFPETNEMWWVLVFRSKAGVQMGKPGFPQVGLEIGSSQKLPFLQPTC